MDSSNPERDPLLGTINDADIDISKPFTPSKDKESSYGNISTFSVVVNCIIGTGVFALPYATFSAGVPLTLITFSICSLFILVAAVWVLEILARTEGYVKGTSRGRMDRAANEITFKKYDFTSLSEVFAKLAGKISTQIVMTVYCLGCLWAYVAVFASTLSMVIFKFFVKDGTQCDVYAPGGLVLCGFATLFTSSAVALNVHYNLPDAIQPMRQKRYARGVTLSAMLLSLVFFVAIGITCALTFGSNTKGLVTLNWESYTGLDGGWGKGEPQWWATVLQLVIVLFPMFNMLSIFPLIATTVGSNVEQFLPKRWIEARPRTVSVLCRWGNTILPVVLTVFVGRLEVIFQFTGLFAYVLELIIPCIYQWLSTRKTYPEHQTPYSGWYSRNWLVLVVLIFGLGAFGFAFAEEIYSLVVPAPTSNWA
ncbi:putative Transmembrane protein [Paratrimastix pyriformis]|uniref:Transmembrane protein n=1 Tax=Paratrimastix pyriformis TaxID=342808 RepID=A0ABQ8UMV9_9EUKA|nr:putative Transmembrane protein [Paratrimastix pyriformis]